jgi:predicted metal-dependent hydrolase
MVKILSALIEDQPTRSWVIGQPLRQAMLDALHLALRLGLLTACDSCKKISGCQQLPEPSPS